MKHKIRQKCVLQYCTLKYKANARNDINEITHCMLILTLYQTHKIIACKTIPRILQNKLKFEFFPSQTIFCSHKTVETPKNILLRK